MDIDVLRYIGAVTREVESRQVDGKPAKVVRAVCAYDTTIEDLWEVITTAERLNRWFLPVSGELREGGRYSLKGNASGVVLGCRPPRELDLTWEMGKDVSWVQVRLSPLADGGTRLQLEHIAHVPDEFWNQYGPGAVGVGWELGLMGLRKHLETGGEAVNREEGMAWPGTPEGKDFVRRSSDGWGAASAAFGTAEADATGAAGRTYSFYTGDGGHPH